MTILRNQNYCICQYFA